MRIALPTSFLVTLLGFGCQGTFGDHDHGHHDDGRDVSETPIPACPIDPDCTIGGDCSLYDCPDYWLCDDLATGGKRCTNPGPPTPDGGGWECHQVGDAIECRGGSFPGDGGGSAWDCERLNDVEVVCTNDSPGWPDGGGPGLWNCWFEGEFRICESGGGDVPGGGGWFCYDTPTGRECRQRSPRYPDDRRWDCHDNEAGETVCSAPGDLPGGGSGGPWDCEDIGDLVVCTDDDGDRPDDGGDGSWDCYFTDEFRVCSDDDTPGGGGGSVCVAGQQRWCDDAIYCSWGKQTCLPDGRWGPCIEPTVTATGLTDRPATECGCRYFYFNEDCCEDQADRDGDGHADCRIPDDHRAPACESDGSLCSYCDTAANCGGANDVCLFSRDGYAFCAQDCSTSGCPTGYECTSITTRSGRMNQCIPTSGSCG